MILVVFLYAVFSAMTFINSSLMLTNPYPLLVGMFRALGSGSIIVLYMALFAKQKIRELHLSLSEWFWLISYGVLIHSLGMCGFSYGVMFANPVTVCFLYASAPFLTAMLLYLYNGTALNKTKILGLCIGLIGLMPILLKSTNTHQEVAVMDKAWLGNGIVLISMIFFCLGWILFNRLIHSSSYPVQLLNGLAMIIGGVVSTLFVVMVYGMKVFELPISSNFTDLLTLFIISSLLTYSLYAYLLQTFSPTFISFAGLS